MHKKKVDSKLFILSIVLAVVIAFSGFFYGMNHLSGFATISQDEWKAETNNGIIQDLKQTLPIDVLRYQTERNQKISQIVMNGNLQQNTEILKFAYNKEGVEYVQFILNGVESGKLVFVPYIKTIQVYRITDLDTKKVYFRTIVNILIESQKNTLTGVDLVEGIPEDYLNKLFFSGEKPSTLFGNPLIQYGLGDIKEGQKVTISYIITDIATDLNSRALVSAETVFCNNDALCEEGETPYNCPADCILPHCGDNKCDATEDSISCCTDCACGDGLICDKNECILLPEKVEPKKESNNYTAIFFIFLQGIILLSLITASYLYLNKLNKKNKKVVKEEKPEAGQVKEGVLQKYVTAPVQKVSQTVTKVLPQKMQKNLETQKLDKDFAKIQDEIKKLNKEF